MAKETDSWIEEKRSAYLYREVAEQEREPSRKRLFNSLAETADNQAEIWATTARKKNLPLPETFRPDLRTLIVVQLIRRLGPARIKPVLAAMKVRGLSIYSGHHSHHEMPTAATPPEKRHRTTMGGGNLRAAVFGANDGLVSNASLILGIAGAAADHSIIILSGIAGMLAGAFSMAAGEFVSVKSQRDLFEYQIGLEKEELDEYPAEEAMELALIYEAKGLTAEEAKRLANQIIGDPTLALDTLTREELGLNPDDLGSPYHAAIFSFIAFSTGAVIPLLPFLAHVPRPLTVSIVLVTLSLFCVGACISLFTGRGAFWGGLRMLLIGGAAGAGTYFIGRTLGVSL